jgi:hypothetical protein
MSLTRPAVMRLASMHACRPGQPSGALGLGRRPPRPKRPSWGFCAALAGALMLASPALAESPAIAYPDPALTPGAVRTTDHREICSADTSSLRHGSRARSDLIYGRYGIARSDRMQFTLDHLVPLEIGGADVIENLWPEPRRSLAGGWDDIRKDQLERRLAILICSGQIPAQEAQEAIRTDWPAAYHQFVEGRPGAHLAPASSRPTYRPKSRLSAALHRAAHRLGFE